MRIRDNDGAVQRSHPPPNNKQRYATHHAPKEKEAQPHLPSRPHDLLFFSLLIFFIHNILENILYLCDKTGYKAYTLDYLIKTELENVIKPPILKMNNDDVLLGLNKLGYDDSNKYYYTEFDEQTISVVSRMIKRRCSFSQVVTMARLMLMYYVDFIAFMEAPDASWESIGLRADLAPPDGVQLALNLD